MANHLYPLWKKAMMSEVANNGLVNGDLYILLCDAAYAYNDTHAFLDSVPGSSRIGDSRTADGALLNVVISDLAVVDADGKSIANVADIGGDIVSIVMYRWSGVESTSRLVMFMDTGIAGLPLTPNGGDVGVNWNDLGIFQLGGG